ncbi:MAG: NAD(P)H-dependent oxidoreductase [Xanthobacteraceae bacterium]|nr:NAD(P)H-dependent oxidoreductase [Xanthobacteraceae bacterium]
MRVLYVYCHPLPESFHGALLEKALAGLRAAGHEVDLLDLHAEGFDPVLSAEERRRYHDTAVNQRGLEDHVARLRAADALVVQFPVWIFGFPALLKGWFDRVFMPGVAFDLSDPENVKPMLGHIRRIVGITTYGRPRLIAFLVGDPPRKMVKRILAGYTERRAKVDYLALYHMNVATEAERAAFMDRVHGVMSRL